VRRFFAGDRLTQAHRGHLYQLANRAGVPAWVVTLIYWGMTAWAGLCGLALDQSTQTVFLRDLPVFAAVVPFGLWAAYVVCKAAGIGKW
jgi:UDP-GlcNAc:undecaprenyl-phosphate GlcNAc-1-phosphate transferase